MLKAPKRAYEATLVVGGDSFDEMLRELQRFVEHLEEHGEACNMASGGYASGSHIEIHVDKTMTHHRYIEDLNAWLAAKKAEAPRPSNPEDQGA